MNTGPKIATTYEQIELTVDNFNLFSDLIFKLAGIKLDKSKILMVQNRLSKRLRVTTISSHEEYFKFIKKNEKEQIEFINALTTNLTHFFREEQHFNMLKTSIFDEFKKHSKNKNIYVWSAACSAGHEVYSLALVLKELIERNAGYDYRILGTDIDTEMIKTAESGIYKEEVREEIPPEYFKNNFSQISVNNKNFYKVSDDLRKKIKFRKFNLVDERQKIPLKFNVIFLRNVLIYFPKDVIKSVIKKLVDHMHPGGIICIGHSESIHDMHPDLKFLGSSTYQKI